MNICVNTTSGRVFWDQQSYKCALGKGGALRAADKREGDGATPLGIWPIRRVFYRPDRLSLPVCNFLVQELKQDDGWCDDPKDAAYNRPVTLPYPASHERLWREDHVYDLIVELGHNDDPVVPNFGSAVFMHVAKPDFAPTEGCVALRLEDLLDLLARVPAETRLDIKSG